VNRDDIIKWAQQWGDWNGQTVEFNDVGLERFAALVVAREREACAKLAEQTVRDTHLPTGVKIYGWRASKAIRARSNNP